MAGGPVRIELDLRTSLNWFNGEALHEGLLEIPGPAQWQQALFCVRAGDPVILVALDGSELPGWVIGVHPDVQALQVVA